MMYTESEQNTMDLLNAFRDKGYPENNEPKREDKATRRETRYEKWKRSKKSHKRVWNGWCCCLKKKSEEPDNKPLISPII